MVDQGDPVLLLSGSYSGTPSSVDCTHYPAHLMCSCSQLAVCVSPVHLTRSCSWCMPSTCSQVNADADAMVVGASPLRLSSGLQCRLVLHAAHACTGRVALHLHVLRVTCLRPAVSYLATLVHRMLRPIRVHIANPFVQISGLVAGSVIPCRRAACGFASMAAGVLDPCIKECHAPPRRPYTVH